MSTDTAVTEATCLSTGDVPAGFEDGSRPWGYGGAEHLPPLPGGD